MSTNKNRLLEQYWEERNNHRYIGDDFFQLKAFISISISLATIYIKKLLQVLLKSATIHKYIVQIMWGAYRSKPYLPFTEQETAHGLISLYYIYLRNTKIYAYKLLSETMVIFL